MWLLFKVTFWSLKMARNTKKKGRGEGGRKRERQSEKKDQKVKE
jgi:hypothetical protein